jgi:hypothetical protein
MPAPGIIVVAMVVALFAIGAHKAAHGVKRAGRQIGCIVRTGHKCPPKPPQLPPKAQESKPVASDLQREITRCHREIQSVEQEIRTGHADLEGLCLALSDWSEELRILEGRRWKHESSSF